MPVSLSSQPCAQEPLGPCSQSMAGLGTALEHLPAECRREHHAPAPKTPGQAGRADPTSPLLEVLMWVTETREQAVWGAVRTQGRQRRALHVRRDPRVRPRGSRGACSPGRAKNGTPPVTVWLRLGARATRRRGHVAGLQRTVM